VTVQKAACRFLYPKSYIEVKQKKSLSVDQDEAAGDFEILSEEDEEKVARMEQEMEMEISEINDEVVFLEKLAVQLEE